MYLDGDYMPRLFALIGGHFHLRVGHQIVVLLAVLTVHMTCFLTAVKNDCKRY